MRDVTKKMFILVTNTVYKNAKMIIEGPDEQALKKKELDEVDRAIDQKANELSVQYPPKTYEVIIIRASDINDIQQSFPEYSGWQDITVEHLQ